MQAKPHSRIRQAPPGGATSQLRPLRTVCHVKSDIETQVDDMEEGLDSAGPEGPARKADNSTGSGGQPSMEPEGPDSDDEEVRVSNGARTARGVCGSAM